MLAAQHGVTVFVPEGMYPFRKHEACLIYCSFVAPTDSAFTSATGTLKGRSATQLAAVLNGHVSLDVHVV
jgi:hypothetical protein